MMHNKLTTSLRKAFNGKLKDACQEFVLKRTVKVLDKRTDKLISSSEESFPGYGPFLKIKKEDIDSDSSIASNDLKVLVIQDDFNTTPQIDDQINHLRVIAVGEDPTSTIWKIFLRGKNGLE